MTFDTKTFTSRWLALAIDYVLIFSIFFTLKFYLPITYNWAVVFTLYVITIILIPAFFFHGITLGRKIAKLQVVSEHSAFKRYYALREAIKLLTVVATVGFILPITAVCMGIKNTRALHEYFSKVTVIPKVSEHDIPIKDKDTIHFHFPKS